jgi:hypothetical protein
MYYAKIAATASGAATVVPAATDRRILVISYFLCTAGATTLIWQSNATAISGTMTVAANAVLQDGTGSNPGPMGMTGIIQTEPGEALNLNLGSSVVVGGYITYILT